MAQEPNKKRKKAAETETVTAIATRAKCSRTLVLRLLRRGLIADDIVQRAEQRRARMEARASRVNGHASEPVNGFPTVPTVPAFAESERVKEHALSQLRVLELQRRRCEVLPVAPWRAITITLLTFQKDMLWRLPGELSMELAMRPAEEIAVVMRRHIEAIFHASQALFESEAVKYNLRLPPEPPPRPRPRELPYYQQYVKSSSAGELENITREQEIGSPEWLALHPSISFQESFQYSRAKKQWDADMADLLNRRREWDLPPEAPVEPSPQPEAA